MLAFTVLLGLAGRHVQPWVAAALGVTFIPIGVELTCYYYAFIIAVALLYEKREEVGIYLLFLTAFTSFIAAAPFKGMARWLDEQYTTMSVATVAVFALIVWRFRERETEPEELAEAAIGGSRRRQRKSGIAEPAGTSASPRARARTG